MRPSRVRRSARLSASARIAMISDAAVMTKPVSRAGTVLASAQAGRDLPQRAIVHVHAARPEDFLRIDPQIVAEVQVRVDQRREQVVRRRDGVEVAGEVQVDACRSAAATPCRRRWRRPSAEHRAERRLAQRGHGSWPSFTRPCVRPIVLTVLPSPLVVGVMAVTRISLPRRFGKRSSASSRIFAIACPYGSSRSAGQPRSQQCRQSVAS